MYQVVVAGLAAGLALQGCAVSMNPSAFSTLNGERPVVIAHRGASGYLPEHTLAAYEKAIDLGADFIEADLVSTRDKVLIARHEPMLGSTTDVAHHPEFSLRKTRRAVDGLEYEDWFAGDFTLAEIKRLRAVQPRRYRSQAFNGQHEIPTLDEMIELVRQKSRATGRRIGLYLETKHPTFHDNLGLSLEEPLLRAVKFALRCDVPVIIQSFEVSSLKTLDRMLKRDDRRRDVKLVQLIDAAGVRADGQLIFAPPRERPYDFAVKGDPRTFGDLLSDEGLKTIARYADGIGPWKRYIVSVKTLESPREGPPETGQGHVPGPDADTITLPASDLIRRAHARGLFVHAFTFRNEAEFLASDYDADPKNEYRQFYALGVDGVFSDFPDTALAALQRQESEAARLTPPLH